MKYLLTVLLSVIAYSLAGQESVSVSGFVVDKHSTPIEGATIRALTVDSIFLSGTTTTPKGYFTLKTSRKQCLLEITALAIINFINRLLPAHRLKSATWIQLCCRTKASASTK